MCHEQPQKSRSTTKQRVDTVVVPSASSSYHTNAKKNSGSESATTAALDNRKASASASSQPSSASNATKERLPSHRDDLVALGHPLIALPHYLSPQTQDMCAHLERMGKNTRILAPGVRPLPADVPMSGIDASHLLSKNFIPMPWGERPSGQASQGSSGLEKADGKSQKQAMQSYQPQKKRYHCIVRLCRRYSIWIRAIAICLAGASSILFLTSYYALDADPKVHTYGITLAPILYAAATALLAFLISGLAVPTLIWRTPTQIYRALAMADGVVMTCWLVAGIIILSPTDDPVAPRPFVCNPSYNHISTCKRLTAGSILTFLSAVVHVALLGSSLLHIRRRRLAELIDKC
ncbi:hypothetical protein THASP1DRAFT_22733 [Thamnocephalis sphaerospora]|uniref:Uncharacterized protein n=1 Tax=Thamnocephalis sphaerospora TaxID=78915 RepID=A0A4V1IX11_9FUNG|nr:hypothetical protein THASP1DRAFT_33159 [Thamnocephalis sphaerospora]RKP09439.1 hypothetical protein THASP1DRAFT_22733 [Thamnocephalis sphaerospora]|eukprot:RKP05018.1 hypothetical protein THASP1DRAFT_33159 [Thamnocephalis sphaerospora]